MLHTLISETVKAYLDQHERVTLPPSPERTDDQLDKVWASSLGTCPLRNFKERSKAEPVLPYLAEKSLADLLRMEQGTRYAQVIQEAMVWKFKINDTFRPEPLVEDRVLVETSLESEELLLKGRADLIYRTGSEVHVIEIKKPMFLQELATPYDTYVYQALAYKFILEDLYPALTIHAHILIANTNGFNLWTLSDEREEGEGFNTITYWDVLNEDGVSAGTFADSEVISELSIQQSYLFDGITSIPRPDFANDPQYWLCARWAGKERPKKYKDTYKGQTERREKMVCACPHWCHSPI